MQRKRTKGKLVYILIISCTWKVAGKFIKHTLKNILKQKLWFAGKVTKRVNCVLFLNLNMEKKEVS